LAIRIDLVLAAAVSSAGSGRRKLPGSDGALPLRICYVLDFLPTYVVREAAEVMATGLRFEIHLSVRTESNGLWEKVLEGADTLDSTVVRRDLRKDWCTAPAGRMLLQAFPSAMRSFMGHPLRYSCLALESLRHGTFRYFLAGAELAVRLRGTGTSLVHSHFARDAADIAFYAAALLGVPFTVTTHATDIFSPEHPDRLRALLGAADGIHTISVFNREYMADHYGEGLRARITVSVLGLDPASLPERISAAAGEIPSFVCTASGLALKKGVEVLLEACRILLDRGRSFTCSVLGSDPSGERLEHLRGRTAEMGLADTVTFAGLTSSAETLRRVSCCTVFVLPSVRAPNNDMDGIPVSLMESMAMGVPSISTRLSGIPELIEDGVSGLLVEPGDAAALAGAMERILADSSLASRLGSAGREKVLSSFSIDRYARDLISFWRGIQAPEGGVHP
jgi:glycosyltransferase involved in cell wall biosynthesis